MSRNRMDPRIQLWIEARKRHRLSNAHVQMARELGLNPKKLGKIDNAAQEPWKQPLPEFIERLYFERFGRSVPKAVHTIEERVEMERAKKEGRREEKVRKRAENQAGLAGGA